MSSFANTNNKISEQPITIKSDEISTLIADLNSHDGLVRQKARNELIRIGKPAIEALIQAFNSRDDFAHWEAVKALSRIGSHTAARALVKALEDDQFSLRWLAAEGLIAIGRDGLGPLLEALEYKANSVWLREGAHHILYDLVDGKSQLESSLKAQIEPVLTALDDMEPAIAVPRRAQKALRGLEN